MVKHLFPLPHERPDVPRFDGGYGGPGGPRVEFARDGTLRWDGVPGRWHVHGKTLHVSGAEYTCEGAIGITDVFLICASATGQTELVLPFVPEREAQ